MNLRKRNNLILATLYLLFVSCEKEEIAIPPHEVGDEIIHEIEIGADYGNQLFFDLGSNKVVSSNLKSEWDLGFQNSAEHVIINSAKGMAVHRSTQSFESITSHSGLNWNWDAHSGNLDSTAVGNWQVDNFVYVVDRGYDQSLTHQGYYKFQYVDTTLNSVIIQYAELAETVPITIELSLTEQHLFSYFSFDEGLVSIAPEDDQYDLVFTQYTHLFTDPETPYLVTGVLLNRTGTSAALIDNKPYNEVSFEYAQGMMLSEKINSIGYDWKWFDFEAGIYLTNPEKIYVLKTNNGSYYKIRFTDFYNDEGLKGFPTIEFQAL